VTEEEEYLKKLEPDEWKMIWTKRDKKQKRKQNID